MSFVVDRRDVVLGCLTAVGCAPARPPGAPGAGALPPDAPPAARRYDAPFFDVREHGAAPDGKTMGTAAIARAIAAATARGGGTVVFPAGDYLTGPIRLASNVTLFVDAGATLRFSQNFDDYLPMVRLRWEGTEVMGFSPLIYAVNVENVAIHGRGTIDGQGEPWWHRFRELKEERQRTGKVSAPSRYELEFARQNRGLELPDDPLLLEIGFLRPPLVQLIDCRNVSVRDVRLTRSPFWTLNPVYCDGVTVSGVTIENPEDGPNTDGINPDSCRNVHISDCHISVGDDCITIKSGRDRQGRRIGRPAENYTITNSTMLRGHGGVVIGSEMSGSVRKIVIDNCVFDGTDRGIRIKSTRGRGGVVEDVRVSNVVMKGIREEALMLNLHYTDAPEEPVSERTPHFRRIHVSGVTGEAKTAVRILGLPEAPIEDVTLSDVRLRAQHGVAVAEARGVSFDGLAVEAAEGPALDSRARGGHGAQPCGGARARRREPGHPRLGRARPLRARLPRGPGHGGLPRGERREERPHRRE